MKRKSDYVLIVTVIILTLSGILAIYSTTYSYKTPSNVIVQSVAAIIGLTIMLIVWRLDYEQYKPLSLYIFILTVLMLALVLVAGKTGKWGSKSWIKFGPVSIQPSEFAKCTFIITLSYHLDVIKNKINKPIVLLGLLLHLFIPVSLILMQPDFGTSLVFVFMFCIMIYTAKLSYKYIIPAIIGVISFLPVGYSFLSDYQKKRIEVFFNPESDPLNSGYNVIQSKIAVGSGKIYGHGFLNGPQNQLEYLPAKSTDFIFSCIAEEFGFIGAVTIIILLFTVIIKCINTARKSNTLFGRYICIGTASMLLFHTVENIGMCIGLMPVTGIPLPFLSYGGTSLISNFTAIGLVMSVSYYSVKTQ